MLELPIWLLLAWLAITVIALWRWQALADRLWHIHNRDNQTN